MPSRDAPFQVMMYEKPMRTRGLARLISGIFAQIASRSTFGSAGRCIFTNSSFEPESSDSRIQSRSSSGGAASSSTLPRLPFETIATCSCSSFR